MTANIAQDLAILEELIRKLQVSYEQFFSGAVRQEPLDLVQQVEGIIRLYSQSQINNSVVRFRYNNLVARYNSFKNVWDRRRRELENTAPSRTYGLKAGQKKNESFTYHIAAGKLRDDQVAEICNHYVELRKKCNEPVDNIRLQNFKAVLSEYINRLQNKTKCHSVLVKLDIYMNKSRIAARPFE